MSKMLFAMLVLTFNAALADNVQVTLRTDKSEYAVGETISLSYETLWLGQNDGQMRLSSNAFPEIEVLYLNRFPVELAETGKIEPLREPSRHEMAIFAPTMSRISRAFAINDGNEPTRYLNGKQGYYQFDRLGTYIIRAVFRADTKWQLFDDQESDVYATVVAIRIVE